MSAFDRAIADWIETDGPSDVPAATVERALVVARSMRQRRRHVLPDIGPWRRPFAIGLALVALALAVAGAIVASLPLRSPEIPLLRIAPDPRLEGVSRAILLGDGRVLVLGVTAEGGDVNGVLDPVSGATTWLGGPDDPPAWDRVAATLPDGRVLLAGGMQGDSGDSQSTTAAILDPATMTVEPVDPMTEPRGAAIVIKWFSPTTVTLPDGRLLIVGGTTDQMTGSTEPSGGDLFDPATGHFTATPRIPCPDDNDTDRSSRADRPDGSGHEVRWASLLADGRVLLACDEWPAWPGRQSLLVWDVAQGTFEEHGIVLDGAHRMLPMADGSLLLWMWRSREEVPTSGEMARHEHYTLARFDPVTGTLIPLPAEPLSGSGATLLADGRVVLVGGFEPGAALPSGAVQVLDPCSGVLTTVATLESPRADAAVVEARPGQLLVIGGDGGDQVMSHPVGSRGRRDPGSRDVRRTSVMWPQQQEGSRS